MSADVATDMAENSKNTISNTINKFSKNLTSFIRGKVNSPEDADDIAQEVWYQLSNFANIDDIESISGWIYQVARNKITDLYRKKKPESIENYSYENDEGEFSFKEILLLDNSENPEMALFKELFWSELLKALEKLPENQKQVFILNEIEDFTLQEIADQTNENLKTIISRKRYAVKYLRKKLNYLYQELNY